MASSSDRGTGRQAETSGSDLTRTRGDRRRAEGEHEKRGPMRAVVLSLV